MGKKQDEREEKRKWMWQRDKRGCRESSRGRSSLVLKSETGSEEL